MNWRILFACFIVGTCLTRSAYSLDSSSRDRKETSKSSDGLFFDDEELAQADEASGSGPVAAPDLDEPTEEEDEDVIEEDGDDVSVLGNNQPGPVTPTVPTSSAVPVTPQTPPVPKVSAVASRPVAGPPTSFDDDIELGSGSGAGPDVDAEDDYEDVDETSITGENEEDETEDEVEEIDETTVRPAIPQNPRVVVPVNTPPPVEPQPPAPTAEPPREEVEVPAGTTPAPAGPTSPPVDTSDSDNGGKHTLGQKPADRPVSFFAQPGILAGTATTTTTTTINVTATTLISTTSTTAATATTYSYQDLNYHYYHYSGSTATTATVITTTTTTMTITTAATTTTTFTNTTTATTDIITIIFAINITLFVFSAIVGGAVVGLLCAILLVMFIVYRMRKKDEGSYALDEPKRSPNSYAYNKNSREFFA
nr:EOG090X0QLW [Eulimnadia texana]